MDNNRSCLWDSDYESEHCVWNRFNIAKCKSKRRDGQFCSFDNNCRSGVCASSFTCGRKSDGEVCAVDNDCKNRDCNSNFRCGKLENNSICLTDSDCQSGRCGNLLRCAERLESGVSCLRSSDCISDNCVYSSDVNYFSWIFSDVFSWKCGEE